MANRERTYLRAECAVFKRTREKYGSLSNMAGGLPIRVNGIKFRTSEALYQACGFPSYPGIQKRILRQNSPMIAARISRSRRKRYGRKDWDEVQDQVMMWCLRAKLACNYERFGSVLESTGRKAIVEESARDRYWGAVRVGRSRLVGVNKLGQMLERLRREYRTKSRASMTSVKPPPVRGIGLMGKPVGAILGGSGKQLAHR